MTITAAIKRHRAVLLLCVIAQAALGVVATRSWLMRSNTLQANGRWVSTKTVMERGLNGAFPYITERNALAGGELNLHAWYGYNELVSARPLGAVKTVEFDVGLSGQAWIVAGFNRSDHGYDAVRLSTVNEKPSAFLRITTQGEFLFKQHFESRTLDTPGDYHARFEFEGERVVVFVDDVLQGEFSAPLIDPQRISFHGNLEPTVVDNIVVTLRDGGTITEDFDAPPASRWLLYVVIAAAIVFNALLFLILCRLLGTDDRFLGFKMLMISVTLLGVGAVFNAYVVKQARWYPKLDSVLAAAEAYYQKGERDNVLAEIDGRHERGPHASVRILVLGASQTWGAGALRDEDVWVRRLEELLNADPGGGQRFECINGGISSSRAWHFMPLMKKELLDFEPDLVVINLSSNDRGDSFIDGIRGLASMSMETGARVVLVKEANAPLAVETGLVARHEELDIVAAELGLEVIDMQTFLDGKNEAGLLWWDKVHLTSFGQELMAGEMARQLMPGLDEISSEILALGQAGKVRINAWNFSGKIERLLEVETPGLREQLAEYISEHDVAGRQRLPGDAEALALALHFDHWTRGERPAVVVVTNTRREPAAAVFELAALAPSDAYPIDVIIDDGIRERHYTFTARGKISVLGSELAAGERRLLSVRSSKSWSSESDDRLLGVNLSAVTLTPQQP